MDAGKVVQFDTPDALSRQTGTVFAELLSKASDKVRDRMRQPRTVRQDQRVDHRTDPEPRGLDDGAVKIYVSSGRCS